MQQDIITKLQFFFPAYPIEKAWIFGSYARGEETKKSDIDIMVRFDKDADVSLLDYVKIINRLKDVLQKKIDLVEEGQLYRWAQNTVDNEKILIYERKN